MAFSFFFGRKRHPHLFLEEDEHVMQRTNPSVGSGPEPGINDELIYGRLANKRAMAL